MNVSGKDYQAGYCISNTFTSLEEYMDKLTIGSVSLHVPLFSLH